MVLNSQRGENIVRIMPRKSCCKKMGVKYYTKKQRRENYKLLRANGIHWSRAINMRDWRETKIFEICKNKALGLI